MSDRRAGGVPSGVGGVPSMPLTDSGGAESRFRALCWRTAGVRLPSGICSSTLERPQRACGEKEGWRGRRTSSWFSFCFFLLLLEVSIRKLLNSAGMSDIKPNK